MHFDPAAATAAYMATISPQAMSKAVAYTHGAHWLVLWDWIIGVAVALVILRTGVLPRLAGSMQRTRPRPALTTLVVVFVFQALSWLVGLPWSIYESWWREKGYGFTSQSFAGWLSENALSALISITLGSLFLLLLYILIRRAGRTWWAWGGGLMVLAFAFMLIIAPIFIEPLFNSYKPAPPGAMRDAVVQLAKVSGVPSDKIYIYDGSKQSNRYTANVSGILGSARVAMSDVMFKQGADVAEVRGVVGHEMGHYAHGHSLWLLSAFSLLGVIAFFLVDRLYAPVLRLTGAEGVGGIGDPAGVPVVVIIVATLTFLGTPVLSSITRMAESDADHFSLVHANEPDGLSKALVKTIGYRAPNPGRLEEVIFYDHPSVSRRVRRAMDWKAAHMTAAGEPGAAPPAASAP